jgi:hypothetical protein
VPDGWYWAALGILTVAALVVRAVHRGPVSRHVVALAGRDLGLAAVCVLALGFHCAAMFFPAATDAVPGADGIAEAVRDLGAASQVAYWVPAALLLVALRRAWTPVLAAEAGALLAVGVTMFWSVGLTVHLIAIAGSVAMTLAVLMTATAAASSRESR